MEHLIEKILKSPDFSGGDALTLIIEEAESEIKSEDELTEEDLSFVLAARKDPSFNQFLNYINTKK